MWTLFYETKAIILKLQFLRPLFHTGGDYDMKKLSSIIIVFIMLLCFSACKDGMDKENAYLPQTEFYTNENSSGFHREYKTIFKYDEKGNVIKKTEYTKSFLGIFNVRENQYDITYTYNENGDISKELIHIEDFCTGITDGHQSYDEGYNYIYNEKQQLIKKEIINPSNKVILADAFCGYEYEYDEFGNCLREYRCFVNGTKELEFENTYDTQNKLIKRQEISNFTIWNETEYIYDNNGKLVHTKTVYYESTGKKSHYLEAKYYYDKFGRLIKEEETIFEDDGEVSQTNVKEYKDFV